MLFYNGEFIALFSVFLLLYFYLPPKGRIALILLTSYVFYGWWDYRFLSLLLISTVVDYTVGLRMSTESRQRIRRLYLLASIVTNIGILGFFKYFNFFIDTFVHTFGLDSQEAFYISVLLPPGISFYTFQTLSYSIDVYRRKAPAERNFSIFAAYVAFFPQLIAGPIERPRTLLPQLKVLRKFRWTNIYLGTRLVILGCFKKLVIADNLAPISDAAFENPDSMSSLGLLIAAYCFAFQIYCDFSGYTDMARGIARMIGIRLSLNFNLPYLSKTLREFWRRWHITLSYWLRDYVYFPLGDSLTGPARHALNLLITFGLSGLWHGAAWTFVLWGVLHAVWILVESGVAKLVKFRIPAVLSVLLTFHVVVLLWVLFRAETFSLAVSFYQGFVSPDQWKVTSQDTVNAVLLALYASPLVLFSLIQYKTGRLDFDVRVLPSWAHSAFLGLLLFFIFFAGSVNEQQFIYFQF